MILDSTGMKSLSDNKNLQRAVDILGIIVLFLSVSYVSLRAEPVHLVYIAIISILFSTLITFVFFSKTRFEYFRNGGILVSVCLCVYILIIAWLSLVRAIPEYEDIVEFEKNQLEVMHALSSSFSETKLLGLAKLYMNAPDTIERIQPGIHHKGNMIMHDILTKKIEAGYGKDYLDELYLLAEVGFTYSSKGYAYNWYKNAYEFGMPNALKRYEQRLAESGLRIEDIEE